ncbi:MAG: nitroreductase family protein [Anaerolineae bacterium]|nr:nitroreductase family protein [Anaerolineae bacterium]
MSDYQDLVTPEGVLALLKGRRSIRRYKPDPVPEALLRQVLEAGQWAPSASNRQPWHFIVVRDPAVRKAVSEHAAFFFLKWAHVNEAPVLIVLCGEAGGRIYQRFLHEDVGLAGSQMMLQAAALGLGTCWIGGLDPLAIGAVLKLPSAIEVVGLLTLGFPDEDPPPPSRKPLSQVVHYDVYGNQEPRSKGEAGIVVTGPLGVLLRKLRIRWRG